jgi:DNA-binding transcriptional MerR regulator
VAETDVTKELELQRELHKKLRSQLEKEKSVFASQLEEPSKLGTMGRFLMQGLTMNAADEIKAAFPAAGAFLPTPGSASERSEAAGLAYDASRLESEARLERDRRANPKTAFISEGVGGMASGGGIFGAANKFSKGFRSLPIFAKPITVGAAEGAAFGGFGAQPGERLAGAGTGAAIGAGAGPLLQGVATGVTTALRPGLASMGQGLFGTPKDDATRRIIRALEDDGLSLDEATRQLAAARQLSPNAILPDIAEDATERLARAVYTSGGAPACSARRFLESRQGFANIQLTQAARRAGANSDFDKSIVDVINRQEVMSKGLYKEAYESGVTLTTKLKDLWNRPAIISARKGAAELLENEGLDPRIVDDFTSVRTMDAIKRALDDKIGVARRAGNNNEARVLTKLKNEFLKEIDSQVPAFAAARAAFSGEQAIRDAADWGLTVLKGPKRLSDIQETIKSFSPSEIHAARLGFLDWLADEAAATSTKRATLINKFSDIPKNKAVVKALFPDERAVDNFLQTAQLMATQQRTMNKVLGGSPTVDKATDLAGIVKLGRFFRDAAFSKLNALGSVLNHITGNKPPSPEVIEEIGKILFDRNIGKTGLTISPALRPFQIPRYDPGLAAGAFSGLAGAAQSDIKGLLE